MVESPSVGEGRLHLLGTPLEPGNMGRSEEARLWTVEELKGKMVALEASVSGGLRVEYWPIPTRVSFDETTHCESSPVQDQGGPSGVVQPVHPNSVSQHEGRFGTPVSGGGIGSIPASGVPVGALSDGGVT